MLIKLEIYNKAPSKKKEKNGGYFPKMTYPEEKEIEIESKVLQQI